MSSNLSLYQSMFLFQLGHYETLHAREINLGFLTQASVNGLWPLSYSCYRHDDTWSLIYDIDNSYLSAQVLQLRPQKAWPKQGIFLFCAKSIDQTIPSLQIDMIVSSLGETKEAICAQHLICPFSLIFFFVSLWTLPFCFHCINLPLLLMPCCLFLPALT